MPAQSLILSANQPTLRLDKFVLSQLPGYSRAQVQRLIRAGAVTVDGRVVKAGFRLKGGEQVAVQLPAPAIASIEPEAIGLDIVYEDADLAVINKPAGLVVHPGHGNETGTLVNALLARYPELAEMLDDPEMGDRLGIAHRLDRGTSGLIVAARNTPTLLALMRQFQERRVDKVYLALLEKRPQSNTGLIDAPIARDRRQRKRMAVRRDGKPAQTEFEVLDDDFQGDRALVQAQAADRAHASDPRAHGFHRLSRGGRCGLWVSEAAGEDEAAVPARGGVGIRASGDGGMDAV